jgi:hypothetical protein
LEDDMRTVFESILLASLLSCSGKGDDSTGAGSETDADTDADSDTDTDTDTDVSCTPIEAGHWDVGGTQLGMPMEADVAVDTKTCTFTFSNWSMAMSTPDGGTIDGTDVALTGPGPWSACTGVVKSPTEAAGTCETGGNWTMELPDSE